MPPDVQPQLRMLLTTFPTLRLQNLLSLLRETLPHLSDPERYEWSKANLTPYAARPSQFLAPLTSVASPPLPTKAQLNSITSGPPNVPPPILVSYPPLSSYTNAFLTALNGLQRSLTDGLTKLLAFAREKLLAAEQHPKDGEEEEQKDLEVVRAAGTVYGEVFVPFLRRALVEGVYGVVMKDKEIPMGKELRDTLEELKEWVGEKEKEGVEGTDGVNGNDDGIS
ncbi:uncharacterized protein LAESUDRAFT_757474 [Laetiporus sulphureus 93-53]|uniref:Uncharacterized protein n=1 Tax=Laetiporus sulphureus 93-53 TaxID=1314785 RepID=A0A165FCH1_9APHY|nr:uncharacterized protein LAESUDRAFT_757474 [Laetiporus sulphureus 93-53]KZT08760.1 hypothetical protein LAESUDRAFT_757474 [Laetiporus sulphureus 93-53]